MSEELYAGAIMAMINSPSGRVRVTSPAYTGARSHAEAIGKFVEGAQKKFPPSKGYYAHEAVAMKIPGEWVEVTV